MSMMSSEEERLQQTRDRPVIPPAPTGNTGTDMGSHTEKDPLGPLGNILLHVIKLLRK